MTSSITNWNLNEPDFTSPLDGSLDSIRANYHYLLMVAAHGSVVLPGWNTTVTATDYSEPDTITLTRGSQRIIFTYTWADGSVSAIQMCYDDGVSSPGLYCFPEIPFYYDSDGNPVGTTDPDAYPTPSGSFEESVLAQSPLAIYTFRDSDFSEYILDSSGNNYHLSRDNVAVNRDASSPDLTRVGHPGGAVFNATTGGNWASEGNSYSGAVGLSAALLGATELTIIMSLRVFEASATGQRGVLGFKTDGIPAAASDYGIFNFNQLNAADAFQAYMRTDGSSYTTQYTNPTLADNLNKLYMLRWTSGSRFRWIEVNQIGSPDWDSVLSNFTRSGGLDDANSPQYDVLRLMTRVNDVGDSIGIVMDHISIFNSDLGDATLQAIAENWRTETPGP